MKKLPIIVGILLVLIAGTYFFVTRSTKGPSDETVGMRVPGSSDVEDTVVQEDGSSLEAQNVEGQNSYSITSGSAEFRIDEMLRGEPKQVIGKTENVSGTIFINREDLASSAFGTIRINARTLETDDESRNNMIRRFILKTEDDANEFIAYHPTKVLNLSGSLVSGEKKIFSILGDMTIANVTKPVAFDVEATFTDVGTVEVRAAGKVRYSDFEITIPSVPFVADVTEDVFLVVSFTAGGK
ncbi:MAG: YceI family protein [bacterium]|nr:YceI family protein [bacterium]